MRGMQLVGIVTVVGVLIVTAVYAEVLGAPGFTGAPARDTHVLTIQVFLPSDTAPGEAGSPCLPAGDITAQHPADAHPQLLVTDERQRTIKVVDLAAGTFERQADRLGCRTDAEISIIDSGFSTFTIEGTYRRTMARETLDDRDWSIAIAGS